MNISPKSFTPASGFGFEPGIFGSFKGNDRISVGLSTCGVQCASMRVSMRVFGGACVWMSLCACERDQKTILFCASYLTL